MKNLIAFKEVCSNAVTFLFLVFIASGIIGYFNPSTVADATCGILFAFVKLGSMAYLLCLLILDHKGKWVEDKNDNA